MHSNMRPGHGPTTLHHQLDLQVYNTTVCHHSSSPSPISAPWCSSCFCRFIPAPYKHPSIPRGSKQRFSLPLLKPVPALGPGCQTRSCILRAIFQATPHSQPWSSIAPPTNVITTLSNQILAAPGPLVLRTLVSGILPARSRTPRPPSARRAAAGLGNATRKRNRRSACGACS